MKALMRTRIDQWRKRVAGPVRTLWRVAALGAGLLLLVDPVVAQEGSPAIAWTEAPALDVARDHHGVFTSRDDGETYLYVAGGTNYRELLADVSVARIRPGGTPGPWRATTPLPRPLGGVAVQRVGPVAVLTGGQIATGEGVRGLQRVANVYTSRIGANGELGEWREAPSLPAPRFHHAMVQHEGWLYVVGGQGATEAEAGVFAARVEPDGAIREWIEVTPLPRARSHHAAVVIDGHVYVLGGLDGRPGGYQAAFLDAIRAPILEDGTLGEWQRASLLPRPYATHSAIVRDGYVWILGGVEDLQRFTDAVWRGEIRDNGALGPWEPVASGLPLARGHVHVTPVVDGRVYTMGGRVVGAGPTVTDAVHVGRLPGSATGARPVGGTDGVTGPAASADPSLTAELDRYLGRLELFGFSGAVLVATEDGVVLERGYGIANDETGLEVDDDTPFIIGSLSKQFTAAAILALEMEGRLTTEDPISRFFPAAPAPVADVTVHELLTHTAGLPYLPDSFTEMKSREEVMQEMLALAVDPARAGSYSYSSPGYTILAGIIERASGQSYERYLREALFEPAGMTRTGFMGEAGWESAPRLHSYSGGVDEGALQDFPAFPKTVGAGSVVSTVGDLYRWERALRGSSILSDSARARLFARHVLVQGPVSHGYGWNIVTTSRGTSLVVHAGDLGGYNAELRRYTDEEVTIILLSNRRVNGQGWRGPVMNNLSLIVAGLDHPAPPAVSRAPAAVLEPLAGRYVTPGGGSIEVTAADGVVRVGASGQAAATAIRGMEPGLAEAAEAMNERAETVAGILADGRVDALRDYLHPSLPFDDARAGIRESLAARSDELGPLRSVDVLGTTAATPTTATTAVRFQHERGDWLLHIGWVGGRMLGLDTATELPHATTFAAADDDAFAAYDPFTGRQVTMTFEGAGDGRRPAALQVGGVRAVRSPAAGAAARAPSPSVIYLVRHAETEPDGTRDPALSETGEARAARLARMLAGEDLTAIHTTGYRRTRGTAAAVARATGLEPREYDPSALAAFARELAGAGGRQLVVGHSNTTPAMVQLLGGDPGGPIPEDEYGRIYRLTLGPDGVRTALLEYPDR